MTNADDLIDEFRSVSEQNFIFACQASVPLVFTAELLYQLWNNFKQFDYSFDEGVYHKISHIAVSDLLLSDLCEQVGFEIFRLKSDVRKILKEDLVSYLGKKRRNTIAKFLQEYAGIESNFQHRKKLKAIHALTAQSILDPAEMERQIVHQINGAKTDSEKIDLLMLHRNLVSFNSTSDLSSITRSLSDKLNISLVIEEDSNSNEVLTVNLPPELKARIRKITIAKPEESKKKTLAEQLIEECINGSIFNLDLGHCGLTDEDFKRGGKIDRELRRCVHLRGLNLANLSSIGENGEKIPNKNKGQPNHLNSIPESVGELIYLENFVISGTADDHWGIQDVSILQPLKNLRVLDLRFNRIHAIPNLTSTISHLLLASNELEELFGVASYPNLRTLDISHNKVSSLEPLFPLLARHPDPMDVNFGQAMDTSNVIWVHGNPIQYPPLEVVMAGRESMLSFFIMASARQYNTTLDALVGLVGNEDLGNVNGVVVLGKHLNPALGDNIYFLTVNLAPKIQEYPRDLKVVFPGDDMVFSLQHVTWSSPHEKLNFSLWEFWPADRERLREMINRSGVTHFSFAKSLPTVKQGVTILSWFGQDTLSSTRTISRSSTDNLIHKGAPPSASFGFTGSPLLNDNNELVGINKGPTTEDSAVSILSIQSDVEKMLSFLKYQNGNILRVCLLYSSDVERDVSELVAYLNSRMRKYWIEERETCIDLVLISEQQIQSDNDFPAAMLNSDILLILPGAPENVRMYYYLENVLIELFKLREGHEGPSALIFTRNRLSVELHDWLLSVHAFTSSYVLVDDLTEWLDTNMKITALAKKYQWVREVMEAGKERTGAMAKVVEEMKRISESTISFVELYMNSLSPGKRLAAISCLEAYPNPKHFLWLAGRVGDAETRFLGSRATIALSAAMQQYSNSQPLKDAVDIAWVDLKLSEAQDPNQASMIADLRRRLTLTDPVKSEAVMFNGSWEGVYNDSSGNTLWALELILREGNKLIGVIRDQGSLGIADIHGGIFPDRNFIRFSKRYRRRDKSYYQVEYAGEWKTPNLVTGTWTIYGQKITSTGSFEMRKLMDRKLKAPTRT